MDLPFGPFLLVTRIYHHIFPLMFDGIVELAADDAVAGPTASFGVYHNVLADLLGSVHDQAMHHSQLAANSKSAFWEIGREGRDFAHGSSATSTFKSCALGKKPPAPFSYRALRHFRTYGELPNPPDRTR
jgi:hypothetical protein